MNQVITLIRQGIKFQIRDRKWLLFNLLFPILLLVMTSYFMAETFSGGGAEVGKIRLAVCSEEGQNFGQMANLSQGDVELSVYRVNGLEEGKEELRQGNCSVFLWSSGGNIAVYADRDAYAEKTYVISLLDLAAGDSSIRDMGIEAAPEEIPVQEVHQDFTAADYYGVVIITMMVLYVMIVPLSLCSYDTEHQIIERIGISPVSRPAYYTARILSSIFLEIMIIAPILLFSILVLGANWGSHEVLAGLGLLLTIVMAVFLGMLVYSLLQNYEKSLIVIQTLIIPVWSFLGGGYIKLQSENPILQSVLLLSPIRWLNQGLFRTIYADDTRMLCQYLGIAAGITAVCAVLLVIRTHRRVKT